MNFAAARPSSSVMIVFGITAPSVAGLYLVQDNDPALRRVSLAKITDYPGSERMFAIAFRPGQVRDLIGKDRKGRVIFSGASKLQDVQS